MTQNTLLSAVKIEANSCFLFLWKKNKLPRFKTKMYKHDSLCNYIKL